MSDCHRRIEMFLNALKTAATFHGRKLTDDEHRSLEGALRYFREAAPKHNADEEESLFPRLRKVQNDEVQSALAEVARLEAEHRWAAPLHDEVESFGQKWLVDGKLSAADAQAFDKAIGQLGAMYRAHIDYEDRVLFPLAARVLPHDELQQVAYEMARRRNLI